MSYIQSYGDRFEYFDRCLNGPNWTSLTVLDFGGNSGNLLRDPKSKISQKNYTCLDISRDAVELGRKDFPMAKWHHYDRWNPRFNPTGDKSLEIPCLGTFDLIVACSVFTHTTEADMIYSINLLRRWCNTLAFTIMTPNVAAHYAKKRDPSYDEKKLNSKVSNLDYFYLIDDYQVFTEVDDLVQAQSFYYIVTLPRIYKMFPDVQISPPIKNEIQHCCILPGILN